MNKITLKHLSRKLGHYGIFACLCHATAILFCATLLTNATGDVYFHRFFPMLEHSIVSFIAVLFGLLGLSYIEKEENKNS